VAEENTVNQRLAMKLLTGLGNDVTIVANGRDAVAAATQGKFEIVFMDVQMPIMDGLQATAGIREAERATGAHIPIVAMTAHAMKGDDQRCLAAGMDAYIPKPINRSELIAVLQRFSSATVALRTT